MRRTRRSTLAGRRPGKGADCDSDGTQVTISSQTTPERGCLGAVVASAGPVRPTWSRDEAASFASRGPAAVQVQVPNGGRGGAAGRARLGSVGVIGLATAVGVLVVAPSPVLPVWCVSVAAGIRVASGTRYAWGVLQGSAHPNWMSWSLWGLTAMVAFVAQLKGGAGPEAVVPAPGAVRARSRGCDRGRSCAGGYEWPRAARQSEVPCLSRRTARRPR